MYDGFDENQLSQWMEALAKTEQGPGGFGAPEMMDNGQPDKVDFTLHKMASVVVPVIKRKSYKFKILPRSSFGSCPVSAILGPLIRSEVPQIIKALEPIIKQSHLSLQLNESWNEVLQDFLKLNSYFCHDQYTSHTAELPDSYETWFEAKGIQRNEIRRGEKNNLRIEVLGLESIGVFYELYQLAHKRWSSKNNNVVLQPQKRFEHLFTNCSLEPPKIFVAYHGDKAVSAALVGFNQKTATYLYGASDVSAGKLSASNFLQSRIISYLIGNQIRSYVMGMSGGIRSVERFKEHLGAKPQISYHYKFGEKVK